MWNEVYGNSIFSSSLQPDLNIDVILSPSNI